MECNLNNYGGFVYIKDMSETTNMTLELTDPDRFRQKICVNLGLSVESEVYDVVDDDVLISLLNLEGIPFNIDNNVASQSYKISNVHVCKMVINNADATCALCIDIFDRGCEVIRLDCDHIYHVDCINRSVTYKNSCPICRHKINVYKVTDTVVGRAR